MGAMTDHNLLLTADVSLSEAFLTPWVGDRGYSQCLRPLGICYRTSQLLWNRDNGGDHSNIDQPTFLKQEDLHTFRRDRATD